MTVVRTFLGLGVLLSLTLGAGARADEFRCSIRVIHAVDDPPAVAGQPPPQLRIDPQIDKLRPFLTRPPFTAWHEFVMLNKETFDLKPNEPHAFTLPNGKPAALSFVEHLPDEKGRPHRVRMRLQMGDPARRSLNAVFVVDEGGIVLQAGQRYKHGIMILGTSCEQVH